MTFGLRFPRCGILHTLLAAAVVAGAALSVPAHPSADSTAQYLARARTATLARCRELGIEFPSDFLRWIDADPIIRASVYGTRPDPLPILLQLRSLEIDLGEDTVRRDYPQLALAFAIHASYTSLPTKASPWNDGDEQAVSSALPDVSPREPLVLTIPTDPRVPVDTKDSKRTLDANDHIVNFLEDHPPLDGKPLVGADVIASASLQAEFNAYMKAKGTPTSVDCGDQVVQWKSTAAVSDENLRGRIAAAHNLFHDAYRAKGRMPAERDAPPTAAESMAWFVRNDRHTFSADEQATRQWPRFPLNAPWPVLMMLVADDQPLREREEIWAKFRDQGEMRTYGEYIGPIAQQFDMQSARRVSPHGFNYGSIQMMWKDGGVCGTMGNIGARTHRICGIPSSTAGQPGHCALVLMECDKATGRFACKGEQYATGGDDVTTPHAQWYFGPAAGRRSMAFHQATAAGVNSDFPALLDTLVMQRAFESLDASQRARRCVGFAEDALKRNPYALAAVEAALVAAPDHAMHIDLLDAFNARMAKPVTPEPSVLYKSTVRNLVHASLAKLSPPASAADSATLLEALERQGCDDASLLARCWKEIDGESGFTARCVKEAEAYVASPTRGKGKRDSQKFTTRVNAWAKTLKSRTAKAEWASAMLAPFAGKEMLAVKKPTVDPVVVSLCKLAGREPPQSAPAPVN